MFLRLETPVPRLEILVSPYGNSSFSVWKLEFLSVETEVYNCGNAKELIAFIRLLFVFCCRWQIHSCFSILL